ncbi:MAG: c-type cytochrome [Bacteroidota bacterium]
MRKFARIAGIVILVLIIIVAGGIIYFNSAFPKAGAPPDIKIALTKERIERGKHLAWHVTVCIDCHSTRDWSMFAGPVKPGTEGMGGERYGENLGLPGDIYARNITPAAVGHWSDGELVRAMVSGVNKKGEALFPLMPYMNYRNMSREDVYSVIAYIRTLAPIKNEIPERSLNFPMNMIVKTIPQPVSFGKEPDKNDPVNYGKYLVTIAACADCHTKSIKGEPVAGMAFAGGSELKTPFGIVRVANITPDNETGIGSWTKEAFIAHFKSFASDSAMHRPVKTNEFNTFMPWTQFAGMTTEELGAIYEYLRTLKPVKNMVNRFTPVSEIKQ